MTKEKQIEEMVAVVRNNTEACQTCTWYKEGLCMEDCELEEDNQKICTDLYNAGYRKQSEWISVDERLPETDNKNTYDYNVLVFIPKREGCRQHGMFLGKLKHSEANDGSCNIWNIPIEESEWTVWGWSYFEHPVVTHWMPLPAAPKGEENES